MLSCRDGDGGSVRIGTCQPQILDDVKRGEVEQQFTEDVTAWSSGSESIKFDADT